MATKAKKNSRRSLAKDLRKDQKKESLLTRGDGLDEILSGGRIETFEANPPQETGPNRDGVVRSELSDPEAASRISARTDELLNELGRRLGDEGFIFVAGLVPYKNRPEGGWEIDIDKDPMRVTNINEAASVRVAMGILAYVMESMQGDLEAELGLEAQTRGQTPA